MAGPSLGRRLSTLVRAALRPAARPRRTAGPPGTPRPAGVHDLPDGLRDVGRGGWDSRGRPSEVRLDRLLVVPVDAARRMGAALDRAVFDHVVAAARRLHRC
ncbi:hypothetical protein [Geodermatophilus sp. TF02-6]|uniref:hypothetical protein n=1 Tax=Geodermatophilus sp. TF02-6 TaxID=2250575 RepID=UPI0018F38042|nr:hypothetical protein [Geodermatophilus sp. TF02-6]